MGPDDARPNQIGRNQIGNETVVTLNFNRRVWWRLLAASALAAVLAACGGGGSSATPPASPPPPPVATPPPPSPPPPPADPVNVNIDDPTLVTVINEPVAGAGGMTLVWSDEFDAAKLDPETWFFESGDGSQYGLVGWGNNELQWYLPDNAALEDGKLVITAKRESSNGSEFTSARINTRDRFALAYGRIEASIKLPGGQGLWPAFWMLPQDDTYGTWAASGEIDIVEAVNLGGSGGNTVHGTIHYGGAWPNNVFSGSDYLVPGDATTGFHVYAVEWDHTEIRWYVDDVMYAMQNSWSTTNAAFPAPFDEPFYILLNVAVGGNWPGSPTSATAFPALMEVDYVRVYSGSP